MFNGAMSESNQDRVNLEGVQSEALRQLVEYIYTGEIEVNINFQNIVLVRNLNSILIFEVTEENVQSLLPAANLLSLSWVRDSCCRFLQSQLHPSNCLGIRSFGNSIKKYSFLYR